jgi:hypothetical protein
MHVNHPHCGFETDIIQWQLIINNTTPEKFGLEENGHMTITTKCHLYFFGLIIIYKYLCGMHYKTEYIDQEKTLTVFTRIKKHLLYFIEMSS